MKVAQLGTDSVLFTPTAAATTARTAVLDCAGATYATIRVMLGVEVNTNSTNVVLSLAEADTDVASNYATFNASSNRTVDNTTATIATTHVDLEGRKRYLKMTATPDTTTNGAVTVAMNATLYKNLITDSATMLGPAVAIV
jgi:FlaG/FlaF family flagellin (archaellin)